MVFGDLLKYLHLASTKPACCKVLTLTLTLALTLTLTLTLALTLTKPACFQVPLRRDGRPRSKRLVNVYLHKDACPCTQGEAVRP